MKEYEKPKIVEITDLEKAHGDCVNGYAVTDTCTGGAAVQPGCVAGAIPVASCGGGSSVP